MSVKDFNEDHGELMTATAAAPETESVPDAVHTETPQATTTHGGLPEVKTTGVSTAADPGPLVYKGITWDRTEAGLPKDLKSLLVLQECLFGLAGRQQALNQLGPDEFERCRNVLSKAFHAAQQGLPVIQFAKPTFDRDRHSGRADARASAKAKHLAAKCNGSLEGPMVCLSQNTLIRAAIALGTDERVFNMLPTLFLLARYQLHSYAETYWQLWEQVNYRDTADELRIELANVRALTPERIMEIQNRLLQLESSSAAIIAESACDNADSDAVGHLF